MLSSSKRCGGQDVIAALGTARVALWPSNPTKSRLKWCNTPHGLGADSRVQFVVQDGSQFHRRGSAASRLTSCSCRWLGPSPCDVGAYSLGEDLIHGRGIGDSLSQLKPGGWFVVTRWLQSPPSEP